MSLQDHRMQIYHNTSRKTKIVKDFKFLKYLVYRHLITCDEVLYNTSELKLS